MPRRRREQPPRQQLSFDVERDRIERESAAEYRRAALELSDQAVDTGRFVRKVKEDVVVRAPADAAHYLMTRIYTPFEQFEQEEFWVLLINTKNRIMYEAMVYRGTVNSIQVRVAEIFREAIRHNATSILLSHCHPSGDPTPSPEDARVTEMANRAAELLEIYLLDHIVVGKGRWVSLKERGLGFKA